jgi:hypothetical protein
MTPALDTVIAAVYGLRFVLNRKLQTLARALNSGQPPEDVSSDLVRTASDLRAEFNDLLEVLKQEWPGGGDDAPDDDAPDEPPFVPGREGDHQ